MQNTSKSLIDSRTWHEIVPALDRAVRAKYGEEETNDPNSAPFLAFLARSQGFLSSPQVALLYRTLFWDTYKAAHREQQTRPDPPPESFFSLLTFLCSRIESEDSVLVMEEGQVTPERDAPELVMYFSLLAEKWLKEPAFVLQLGHALWAWLSDRPPHPYANLMRGWQCQPKRVHRDRRNYGILPKTVAHVRELRSETGTLFVDLLTTTGFHGTQIQPNLFSDLPQIDNPLASNGIIPRSVPLETYDMAGGIAKNAGRGGTPLALRLWVEAILSVGIKDRRQQARLVIKLGELIHALWPKGWGGPKRDGRKLEQAFDQIGRMLIPWEQGRWLAVIVRNRPDYYNMDSPVVIDVELPPGSECGPTVYRPMLHQYGVRNVTAYRLSLSLPSLWNKYFTHKGRRLPPVIPEVRRNQAGVVLHAETGRPLYGKGGKPITHWNDRRGWTGEEERNPQLKRIPWLDPADLLEAGASSTELRTPSARRKALYDVRRAARLMEAEGNLVILEDGQRWRLEPPDWWGKKVS